MFKDFSVDYDSGSPESRKSYLKRMTGGFLSKYLAGDVVLDIGYRGENPNAKPVVEHAIGVELDYPGYDGRTLPFADGSVDTVYSSHCLEHIEDVIHAIRDYDRVLRIGGFQVHIVPHQFLYEKRRELPSRYNADHKRFLTPAKMLALFEQALAPNSYRVRHVRDNDDAFDYTRGPELHSSGSYEIEVVIEKIALPKWWLA